MLQKKRSIGDVCCVACNANPLHDLKTSKKTDFSFLLSGSKR